MPIHVQFFVLLLVGWVSRQQQAVIEYLKAENRILREHTGGGRLRFTDAQRSLLAIKGKVLGRKLLSQLDTLVTPDTIMSWYQRLIAKKYTSTGRRQGPGRPRLAEAIAALVLRVALENPGFGYTRISDALHNLKHEISRSSVARILAAHGIEPSYERRKRTSWKTFLAAHWDTFAAADFFTVEVLTRYGLVCHHVLVVMELCTRRVRLFVKRQPTASWVKQIFRNLTDCFDGFLRKTTLLILDRDPLYSMCCRKLLKASGISVVRLPRRSPNLNAYVERFILSIKSEALSRMILLGEGSLRRAVKQFVAHYHSERNHQGLESKLIEPGPEVDRSEGRVLCRKRLGGMLRYYYRDAA